MEIYKNINLKINNKNKKILYISMSGGVDSTLLCYLISDKIVKDNLKYEITPFVLLNKNDINRTVEKRVTKILNVVSNLTGFVFNKKIINESIENVHPKDFDLFDESDNLYLAITKNPPNSIKFKDNKNMDSNRQKNNYIDISGQVVEKKNIPFYHLNKKDLAKIYDKLNLRKKLFNLTFSCITNFSGRHCKKCWWCEERYWAFGEY
jgi:7-cyano-7-deazaguanine synthase in queuosine biosynthesis